jgi:hypothetical protein
VIRCCFERFNLRLRNYDYPSARYAVSPVGCIKIANVMCGVLVQIEEERFLQARANPAEHLARRPHPPLRPAVPDHHREAGLALPVPVILVVAVLRPAVIAVPTRAGPVQGVVSNQRTSKVTIATTAITRLIITALITITISSTFMYP